MNELPARTADMRGAYKKLRVRDSIDYPLAGAAISARTNERGECIDTQVAITAVNPAPLLVKGVAELLNGKRVTEELLGQAADLARKTAKPMKTSLSTMPYRRHMIDVFTKQGLAETLTTS